MDCEEIFGWLTSGPFPTGLTEDADIEAHLSICPDCGALAEALRPAPDLFHESLTPSETRNLPGYHGQALGEPVQVTVATRSRNQSQRQNTALSEAIGRLATATRLFDQPQLAPLPLTKTTPWSDRLTLLGFATVGLAAASALLWALV